MYDDTITLFNRYSSRKLGDTWYPTVIKGVNVTVDRAQIVATQGSDSKDSARIHIAYKKDGDKIIIADKQYLTPKIWGNLLNDELPDFLTFKSGNNFDFLYVGEWPDLAPIKDDDYMDGFYNHMNSNYDNIFAISSASGAYKLIPHFEILAR